MAPETFAAGRRRAVVGVIVVALTAAACGSDEDGAADATPVTQAIDDAPTETASDESDTADEQRFPDVIGATATFDGETWTISATLSSPYDTPERYADSWRVIGPDGTVYGERFLFHDHQNEQPFTRSESGIVIPGDVEVVTIEGRDQEYGWGGGTYELTLER